MVAFDRRMKLFGKIHQQRLAAQGRAEKEELPVSRRAGQAGRYRERSNWAQVRLPSA
jgi:hypothetical protein